MTVSLLLSFNNYRENGNEGKLIHINFFLYCVFVFLVVLLFNIFVNEKIHEQLKLLSVDTLILHTFYKQN